jgi:type II secretory pathway component GspD/PulD (secretin)
MTVHLQRSTISLLLATALGLAARVALAAPDEARVNLSAREAPLRQVVEQLYAGSGIRVVVAPQVADVPVTAELRGVTRWLALRALLRISGQPGITAQQVAEVVTVTQGGGAAPRANGDGTSTATITFGTAGVSGFSVGPGGARIPNQVGSQIQATRRFPNGQATYLGGTTTGDAANSRSRLPLLPGGSLFRSRTSTNSSTFVTVTILPDPLDDGRPGRR